MRRHIRELAQKYRLEDNPANRPRQFRGDHPGLILHRYLSEELPPDGDHSVQASERKKWALEERAAIFHSAINATSSDGVRDLYRIAFERWNNSLPESTAANDLQTQGRLIVGLGSENILETGIRLHHTYGMPIIPGSALKGLAAHYCDWVWGERESQNFSADALRFRGPRQEDKQRNRKPELGGDSHQLLFGVTDDSGCIMFHDAWFVPDSEKEPLKLDVMTPHHPDYNRDPKTDPKRFRAPTDFDSPTPVPFLSVSGMFRIVVSWCGPTGENPDQKENALKWTNLAMSLLLDALCGPEEVKDGKKVRRIASAWGIGGKTSSGYGRLGPPSSLDAAPSETQASAAPASPKYKRGERIKVKRIADQKNKKRFVADDGFIGHFINEEPPDVANDQFIDAWVANTSPQAYTLTLRQPKQTTRRGKKQ